MITRIIGDSHAKVFDMPPNIKSLYIGHYTAHQLERHHRDQILHYHNMFKGDRFVFFFGEIDCRIHIHKKAVENGTTLSDGAERTAIKYLTYLKKIETNLKLNLAVMSVVPTGTQGNFYGYKNYPNYKARKYITIALNNALEYHCDKHHLQFINIFPYLVDKNNDRLSDIVLDDVHVNYSKEVMSLAL